MGQTMAIYTPKHFSSGEEQSALALIRTHPFATLISSPASGEALISHIPLLYENSTLFGHFAKPNPQWRVIDTSRTVAIFHGPHAYIDPAWYTQPADNVPTWNYAVVHVHGCPRLLDEREKRSHLAQLAVCFGNGGLFPTDPAKIDQLAGGIVAFCMPITRMDVKLKMSQNKSPADRIGVIAGLKSTGQPGDAAVANWMMAHE